ncbi:MAG TPA: hypothetical protein VGL71_09465 [Urbifossiella sp.]
MIDELLSDFFKSKLPQPWPAAPGSATAEPSSLHAARRAANQGHRARVTLAAFVAVLIGVCWFFSSGSQPGPRPASHPAPAVSGILNEGSAKTPDEFKKAKKAAPTAPMLN